MRIEEYLWLQDDTKRKFLKHKLIEELPAERHEKGFLLIDEELRILDRFLLECDRLVKAGRKHYAARTIIEVMRHNSLLNSKDPEFKIPNWMPPIMARLALVCFPELTMNGQPFFMTRESEGNRDETYTID